MTTRYTMPFGMHKGTPIDELPDDYLMWLDGLDDLREPLATYVAEEMLHRRGADRRAGYDTPRRGKPCPDARIASDIISRGLRQLAVVHHPDHGGELALMQTVNATADWLRDRVREDAA